MPKKRTFIDVMCDVRDLERKEVVDELSMATDLNNGIKCPVPGCGSNKVFKRWGDMRGHFLDDSTHKRDYFKAFIDEMKEPFCDQTGPGFNHGINSLMLALIRQPTAVEDVQSGFPINSKKPRKVVPEFAPPAAVPSQRPKKVRPIQEQQELLPNSPKPVDGRLAASVVRKFMEPPHLRGPSPSDFSNFEAIDLTEKPKTLFEQVRHEAKSSQRTRSAFSEISELIRDSDQINKVWRGKVWDEYVDMFHGIPPCFHCRSEEGKQIHHQNPLFHEIILVSLNKLGTTAEVVMEEKRDWGNEKPFQALLEEVFAFHMKQGKVCAVPYCQGCNQDAETKRRRGKANKAK